MRHTAFPLGPWSLRVPGELTPFEAPDVDVAIADGAGRHEVSTVHLPQASRPSSSQGPNDSPQDSDVPCPVPPIDRTRSH